MTQQLPLLHRVSTLVSSHLSLDEILGEILGLTVEATQCAACLVYLLDDETGRLVLRASQVPHAAALGTLSLQIGEGVTGWVAAQKSVVALPERAAADPRFKPFLSLVEDTYEALLSVPIINAGVAVGVINVHHRSPHPHTPEEVSLISFLGEQVGSAVARATLAEENQLLRLQAEEVKEELTTYKLVQRAKGILQRQHNLSEEEAHQRLRNESRRAKRTMRQLAEALILAEELGGETRWSCDEQDRSHREPAPHRGAPNGHTGPKNKRLAEPPRPAQYRRT